MTKDKFKVNILIVGAGLGGLAAGICLIEQGHNITILESASQLGEIGAGIQIPPNSARLLAHMGVYDKVRCAQYTLSMQVAAAATWPSEIVFRVDNGGVLHGARDSLIYVIPINVPLSGFIVSRQVLLSLVYS
jgi:2-polyprenyl-6-methoxyphenol hydroxylase-like FAD-dependent oxidoreductase